MSRYTELHTAKQGEPYSHECRVLPRRLGMDGWRLVDLNGRTVAYIHPETARAVASIGDLPEHVREFLAKESTEGRP